MKMILKRLFPAALFPLWVSWACGLTADGIIPADRRTDWTPGVTLGVPGGIPADRTHLIDVTQPPYSADKIGVADAQPAIQNAIADAREKDVVYLPAGTYRLDKPIRIGYKSRFALRGAGPGKTVLVPHRGCNPAIDVGSCAAGADWWYANRQKFDIGGSPKRGATVLNVGNTKGLDAYPNGGIGQIVQVSLKNDPKLPVMPQGSFEYLRKQLSRIVAKTSTTLTLSPGLLFDLPQSLSPVLRPAGARVEFVGIEDLTVDGEPGQPAERHSHGRGLRVLDQERGRAQRHQLSHQLWGLDPKRNQA